MPALTALDRLDAKMLTLKKVYADSAPARLGDVGLLLPVLDGMLAELRQLREAVKPTEA